MLPVVVLLLEILRLCHLILVLFVQLVLATQVRHLVKECLGLEVETYAFDVLSQQSVVAHVVVPFAVVLRISRRAFSWNR